MTDDSPYKGAVATAVAGLAAVVSLALVARASLRLGVSYPIKAAGSFAVIMTVAIAYVRAHHPFARFGAANQITTLRVVLLALVVSLMGEPASPLDMRAAAAAAGASLWIALLDGVDGWLARRTRMSSAFGARFDMETDALLILALSLLAWQYGKAGPWVVTSGLLRYLFIAAGWVFPWLGRSLPPSPRGRAICVVQILTLGLAVAPATTPPASAWLAAGGLLALSYSFLVDTIYLWKRSTKAPPRRT